MTTKTLSLETRKNFLLNRLNDSEICEESKLIIVEELKALGFEVVKMICTLTGGTVASDWEYGVRIAGTMNSCCDVDLGRGKGGYTRRIHYKTGRVSYGFPYSAWKAL